MTYNEIINIAKRLDEETKQRIDKEVEERLEILKLGELNEEEMENMEECLYMSLVIQEYLDGEYELIDEERAFLLEEMEELYGEYNDLLLKAKLEEKVSKKKRMALELMRIREQLFKYKDRMTNVKDNLKSNRANKEKLDSLSNKEAMKDLAKQNKEFRDNERERHKKGKRGEGKFGIENDMSIGNGLKRGNAELEIKIDRLGKTVHENERKLKDIDKPKDNRRNPEESRRGESKIDKKDRHYNEVRKSPQNALGVAIEETDLNSIGSSAYTNLATNLAANEKR